MTPWVSPSPLEAFQRPQPKPAAGAPETAADLAERLRKERKLVCAGCRYPVTDAGERCERAGAHEHRFTNPLGVVYDVGCFRAAPGCAPFGTPTGEHTWFPGFAWRVGLCAGCGEHLGWRFDGSGERFYGLILDRLAEGGAAEG